MEGTAPAPEVPTVRAGNPPDPQISSLGHEASEAIAGAWGTLPGGGGPGNWTGDSNMDRGSTMC